MSQHLAGSPRPTSAAVSRAFAELPPLFPIEQFVAVNPFMGLSALTFESAAERLARRHGRAPLLDAPEYRALYDAGFITTQDLEWTGAPSHSAESLLRALDAPSEHRREVASTAVDALEAQPSTRPLRRLVVEEISKWCAAFYDRNQTTWRSPWANVGLYRAFLEGAVHDVTPELGGLSGFRDFVAGLPRSAEEACSALLGELLPTVEPTEEFIHRQLALVSGWSSFCRYLTREQELRSREHPALQDLLAVRLAYDVALLRAYPALRPQVGVARPEVVREVSLSVLCRWQAAYEAAFQRELVSKLPRGRSVRASSERPAAQAVFCIDVRSERLRRHLEAAAPDVQTLGFAGFFGFAVSHVRPDGSGTEARCPALLVPALQSTDGSQESQEGRRRERERASTWKAIQNAAASCFSFVETLGVASAARLWSLRERAVPAWRNRQPPHLLEGAAADSGALAERAAGMFRGMSLTQGFGRLLLLCGHGSRTANNPFASSLDCGACGGHAGDVNARLAAQTLNRADVRERLAERGIRLPSDTWVLAGLHDTMTDDVELFDLESVPDTHRADLASLQRSLATASEATRRERAESLGLEAGPSTRSRLRERAEHLGETRPEWGLAGNAALIVAPRSTTRGLSLEGRAFLHDYRHEEDPDGAVLSTILAAPVVVTSWINLQYYASRVDPERYGSGNKALHNVVGGIGVFEGNGGDLRVGLPLQSIHDGARFVHEPRRLSVFVEAPREELGRVLSTLPEVERLFAGEWLHLLALDEDGVYAYSPQGFRKLPTAASSPPS
jgi:uncharacterized protein